MHRVLPFLAALVLCLPGLVPPARANDRTLQESLPQRLSARLSKARLTQRQHGVAVLTRGPSPDVVFVSGHTGALIPASVAKVLTTAAALDLLGPSYEFRTQLVAVGRVEPHKARLVGDLLLRGGADPGLSGRFFEGNPLGAPEEFARAVYEAGLREITGDLVLDVGLLDEVGTHPSWPAADLGRWYGAPISGLSYNDNCVDLVARGAGDGQPARLEFPAGTGPFQVENRVRTVAAGDPLLGGLWVGGGGTLRIDGRVRTGQMAVANIPVQQPALFLGGALLRALQRQGVRVGGTLRQGKAADLAGPFLLLHDHHTPLIRALEVMNTRSHNLFAGLIFKLCGASLSGEGTWESGEQAVAEMLVRRRLTDAGATRIVDGSGLSTRNRVTAGLLAQLLASFDSDLLRGPLLYASLPVSGRSGTLQGRLDRTGVAGRVHAKTGTLNDTRVRSLCGYVDGVGGHPGYVFAIVLNGAGASHALIDDLVEEIAR